VLERAGSAFELPTAGTPSLLVVCVSPLVLLLLLLLLRLLLLLAEVGEGQVRVRFLADSCGRCQSVYLKKPKPTYMCVRIVVQQSCR